MLVYTRLYSGIFSSFYILYNFAELSSAFKVVKKKTGEIETRKTVLNNLNYKIKSLYQIYPHLAFYGWFQLFTFKHSFFCLTKIIGPVQLFTFRTVVQVL